MELLTTRQAAKYLCVSKAFLERDRWAGAKVPFVRIGSRTVRYLQKDLEAYVRSRHQPAKVSRPEINLKRNLKMTWRERFHELSQRQESLMQKWRDSNITADEAATLRVTAEETSTFLKKYQLAGEPDRDSEMP